MGIESAIIGSAIVGAYSSSKASSAATSSADKATAAQIAASEASLQATREQLAFSQQQYDDWKSIYGDVQTNLKDYYNQLSPSKLETQGRQAISAEFANASKQLEAQFAQRGITSSGLQAAAMTNLASQKATNLAKNSLAAQDTVLNQKQAFLSLGMGQYNNAVQGVTNAYTNQATVSGSQANMYGSQAAAYTSQALNYQNQIGQAVSGGLNTYLTYNAMQNQNALLTKLAGGK